MHLSTVASLKQSHDVALDHVSQILAFVVPEERVEEDEQVLAVTRVLRLHNYSIDDLEELLANRVKN